MSSLPWLLDELAVNAMSAPTTEHFEGWVFHAAPDWPFRRTNSATIVDPAADIDSGIVAAERFYAARGLPARVRVSSEAAPELDRRLAERGYEIEAPVAILIAESDTVARRLTASHRVVMATRIDADGDDERLRTYAEVLERVAPAGFCATTTIDGHPAGRGIGIVEWEWVGIFGMHTEPEYRRRGVASSVLRELTELAPRAYLQVETDNAAALALYGRAGFTRSHGYHYRTRR